MILPVPRGIRENNPGNLKYNATDKWQGLAIVPTDGIFFVFKDAVYGMRALARTLIAYQDKNGCKTVTDFINRWAPPIENVTASYVDFVAHYMEITPVTEINVHLYSYIRPMIEAIIQQENGAVWSKYFTSDQLDKALVLAGVEPPKKPLMASGQIIGGTIAAVATATPAIVNTIHPAITAVQPVTPVIIDGLHQAQTTLLPLIGTLPVFGYVSAALALIGIGYSMFEKYKERQKGIS